MTSIVVAQELCPSMLDILVTMGCCVYILLKINPRLKLWCGNKLLMQYISGLPAHDKTAFPMLGGFVTHSVQWLE